MTVLAETFQNIDQADATTLFLEGLPIALLIVFHDAINIISIDGIIVHFICGNDFVFMPRSFDNEFFKIVAVNLDDEFFDVLEIHVASLSRYKLTVSSALALLVDTPPKGNVSTYRSAFVAGNPTVLRLKARTIEATRATAERCVRTRLTCEAAILAPHRQRDDMLKSRQLVLFGQALAFIGTAEASLGRSQPRSDAIVAENRDALNCARDVRCQLGIDGRRTSHRQGLDDFRSNFNDLRFLDGFLERLDDKFLDHRFLHGGSDKIGGRCEDKSRRGLFGLCNDISDGDESAGRLLAGLRSLDGRLVGLGGDVLGGGLGVHGIYPSIDRSVWRAEKHSLALIEKLNTLLNLSTPY